MENVIQINANHQSTKWNGKTKKLKNSSLNGGDGGGIDNNWTLTKELLLSNVDTYIFVYTSLLLYLYKIDSLFLPFIKSFLKLCRLIVYSCVLLVFPSFFCVFFYFEIFFNIIFSILNFINYHFCCCWFGLLFLLIQTFKLDIKCFNILILLFHHSHSFIC